VELGVRLAGMRLGRARWLAALCLASTIDPRVIAAQPQAPAQPESNTPRVDRTQLMADVRELASDQFQGRRTGTPGGLKARAWIRDAFTAIGLKPAGPDGFAEPFSFTYREDRAHGSSGRPVTTEYKDAANVLGSLPGTKAGLRYIVVSAHYDHLGVQGDRIFHGADDNASGVAALLATARWFVAHPPRHPMLFVAFDAEELGLKGAQTFVASGLVPMQKVAIDVNLDMVSRNDRNEIFAVGTSQEPWLKPILEDVQRRSAVTVRLGHDRPVRGRDDEDWTELSDQGAFRDAHVPFLYYGVEDHADYHQPTDTADKIDPRFFGEVAEMILDTLTMLDARLR
jgi:Zn-dependent M28 family amino/carboxypeptidase